jgi:hypothetical protein
MTTSPTPCTGPFLPCLRPSDDVRTAAWVGRWVAWWIGLLLPCTGLAQWVTQEIRLVPGYNPVFLQVTPANPECTAVFGSTTGVREVWLYNRYLQSSTFTTEVTQSAIGQDHWLTWFAPGGEKSFLSTLTQVRGGQSYLIKLPTNAVPVTLRIQGIPQPPRSDWIPNDVVLAGFPISETERVTFYQFLKDSPQVSAAPGQESGLFTVNPLTAIESQIRNPETTRIVPGRAYWASLQGHTHNPYPFTVSGAGDLNSVQFLQDNLVASLTLRSAVKSGSQRLRLRLRESEPAPLGQPRRAGPVPLAALLPRSDGSFAVQRLAEGLELELSADEQRNLRLGLIAAELQPSADTNATYQAFIEVTAPGHGYRQLVPVVAEVPGSRLAVRRGGLVGVPRTNPRRGAALLADAPTAVGGPALSAGLWVGTLSLKSVNRPGFSAEPTPNPGLNPQVAATPLNTRVLVHVDSNGVSRLVTQIFFADVPNGTNRVTRLYSSLTNLPTGAAIKSRLSAPSWPPALPTPMLGRFGSNVSATLTLGYNDRVNPFVHRYHPDHNNLAEDFRTVLPAGRESFDLTRNVQFFFGDTVQLGQGTFQPSLPVLRFTGVAGEYLQTSPFTTTPAWSVQCWVKLTTLQQQGAPLVLLTNAKTGAQARLGLEADTGNLTLTIRNASGASGTVISSNALPVGTWINVVASYDGTLSGALFVNGAMQGSGYLPAASAGDWDALWVGNEAATGTPGLLGAVHDVVVRNGALSLQNVPQVTLVPQVFSPADIVLQLQGRSVTTNVVNLGSAAVTLSSSGSGLLDLSAAPSVPLWTLGTAQGLYQETIVGLRRQAITVQGSFQFTRVSQDPNLF